jgi:signal transduction histidine kinase
MVNSSGRHLLALINNLLDLSKIRVRGVDIRIREFDPAGVVEESVEMLRPLADEKGLAIRAEIEPGGGSLHSDERKFRQVLLNLVGNALKFTDTGQVVVKLVRWSSNDAVVSVADTGHGISEDDLPHLFEAFTQFEAGPEAKSKGTGLGLTISREYVQMLGGRDLGHKRGREGIHVHVLGP